jgi:outer membrane protein TolC
MIILNKWWVGLVAFILTGGTALADSLNRPDNTLTLDQAVEMALRNDPWLVGNQHTQDSIESMSIAAGTLPDPKVSLGLANIATDTFDFSQEGMTQFKVGVSQMFPRGDSLALKRKKLQLIGSQYPFMREDRKAKVILEVAKLWLDIYRAQESIALIERDRSLFEQLSDVAQASYSSALGKTRQQDIVRAQLELTRLDDRLTVLRQNKESSLQKLAEFLNEFVDDDRSADKRLKYEVGLTISSKLPNISLLNEALSTSRTNLNEQQLYRFLVKHPVVRSMDQKIAASSSDIDLAKQKYKPEWGVNAGYGLRDDSPSGVERSDLFSVGISFDIPLFTGNKQDREVQSAVSKLSAVKTEKWLLIRKLTAQFETHRAQLVRLNERLQLFEQRLLPQMHDQAEASLTAYTNDDGDFAEVVRSRIAELNASIDALSIKVERQQHIVQLNYYFIDSAQQIISKTSSRNMTRMSYGENK